MKSCLIIFFSLLLLYFHFADKMDPRQGLQVFYTHLSDGFTAEKYLELRFRLQSNPVDAVAITGITTKRSTMIQNCNIPCYNILFREDLVETEPAGICMYVSERIKCGIVTDLVHPDMMLIAIDGECLVGCVYEQQSTNRAHLMESLCRYLHHPRCKPIIVGHFNGLLLNRNLQALLHLTEVELVSPMSMTVKTDLLISKQIPAQHHTIMSTAGLGCTTQPVYFIQLNIVPNRKCFPFTTVNLFDSDVNPKACSLSFDGLTPTQCLELLHNKVYRPYFKSVPVDKLPVSIAPPWNNNVIKDISDAKYREWHMMLDRHRNSYKHVSEELKCIAFRHKATLETHLLEIAESDGAVLDEYYCGAPEANVSSINHIYTRNGKRIENNKAICEEFAREFKGNFVFNKSTCDHYTPIKSAKNLRVMDDMVITEEVVMDCIKSSKSGGAGPDRFKADFMKQLAPVIAAPLSVVFNKCLEDPLSMPKIWKISKVFPRLKKNGDPTKVTDYRPISVCGYISKLMERIVVNHIDKSFVENNSILSNSQHGYKTRSSSTNLVECFDICVKALDAGRNMDVVYLDIAKAYDTVPHQKLLNILAEVGIPVRLLNWITAFLTERKQYVAVNGATSHMHDLISGVPQGSVLSNLLFTIFMNNVPTLVKSRIFMYCDDVKIIAPVTRDSSGRWSSTIQQDIVELCTWAQAMQMSFSLEKCSVMHFGESNPRLQYKISNKLGEYMQISVSHTKCDLGVHIDDKLSFNEHCVKTAVEVLSRIEVMKSKFTYLTSEVFSHIYCKDIRGKLEYASCVYSPNNKRTCEMLEGVQRHAVNAVNDLENCTYTERLKRIGIPTLQYRRKRADLIMFYKYYVNENGLRRQFKLSRQGHSRAVQLAKNASPMRAGFFFERAARSWNLLPEEIVTAKNVDEFAALLDKEENDNMYDYSYAIS